MHVATYLCDLLTSEGCSPRPLLVTILEISDYALDSCAYVVMHVLEWFNQGLNTIVCVYIAVLCMLVFYVCLFSNQARAWFLKIDLVWTSVCVCVCVCVCPPPRLLITSGMMWRDIYSM